MTLARLFARVLAWCKQSTAGPPLPPVWRPAGKPRDPRLEWGRKE